MAALSGTSGLASLFSQAAYAADSDIADGQSRRFDFSVLQSMAHDLAKTPWGGAPRPLPETLATMTPQAYNAIRYDEKQSLWNNIEGRQLDAQFFHMGMGFRRRVRMFSLDQSTSQAREIHFRPELFSYGDTSTAFPRAGWRWIPLLTPRKSSRISPPSGLKPLSRAIPPLPSMRCWTARALPVPISL